MKKLRYFLLFIVVFNSFHLFAIELYYTESVGSVSGGSLSTDPNIYNVKDYGLIGNGITDDRDSL